MNEALRNLIIAYFTGVISAFVVLVIIKITKRRAYSNSKRIEELEQRAGENNSELAEAERRTREAIERAREANRESDRIIGEQAEDNRRAERNNKRIKELIERAEQILVSDVD